MGNILKKKASERLTDSPPSLRYIVPNHLVPEDTDPWAHPNRGYHDNHIKTTKYTILSFLPKNLFEQFHRLANMYFVFIVLLNWVPVVNAIIKEIAMIPLLFVLSVTGIKDAYEDWRRYKSDNTINHQHCRIYSKAERRYLKCEWKEVKVGDIVHLSCNEVIPADMVLLRSSDDAGVCHIDTANIDGENNLKQRNVIRGLKYQGSEFHPTLFTHTIECELPSLDIYKFHGALLTSLNEKIPVNNNNLLLRGCIIRNTDYVEAIVVYAGHETKALLNNRGPRYKRSKIERHINRDVLWCVILLFIMCFGCAWGSGSWLNQFRNSTEVMYIPYESLTQYSPVYQGLVRFWTFIILFQVMIPLSMYVTIELVKLGQVYFIHEDAELYHAPTNKRVECRALNITEDLGQVQYVFSDKTGTLTENKMVFKKCTIGGKEYSTSPDTSEESSASSNLNKQAPDFFSATAIAGSSKNSDTITLDPSLQRELQRMSLMELSLDLSPHTQTVHEFFLLLAVCNTVCVSSHEHLDLMDSSGNWPGADVFSNSLGERGGQSSLPRPTTSSQPPSQSGSRPLSGQRPHSARPVDVPDYSSLDRYTRLRDSQSFEEPVPAAATQSGTVPTERHYNRLRQEFGGTAPAGLNNSTSSGVGGSMGGGGGGGGGVQSSASGAPPQPHSTTPSPRDSLNKRLKSRMSSFFNSPTGSYVLRGDRDEDGVDDSSTEGASLMSENTLKHRYEAESPDELALVKAACSYGCRLVRRTPERASIWLPGEGTSIVEILHVLPFDAFRKRMSVIVRHPVTKDIVLYCKGADSNVYMCLKPASNDRAQQEIRERTNKYLTDYAKLGLRTLCMAKRVLSTKEYDAWKAKHEAAENAMHGRDRLLHQSACRIETHLTLLGATGIEDRLQENVPETIFALREAGIRVWVLTGDKQETALNIAYSAKLFSFEQQLIILNAKNKEMAESLIRSKLEFIESLAEHPIRNTATAAAPSPQQAGAKSSDASPVSPVSPVSPSSTSSLTDPEPVLVEGTTALPRAEVAMVIDGKTLGYALEGGDDVSDAFLRLAKACSSVLCVRATPFQKAAMVKLVRDKLNKLTLAIGDGANDVSMIQTADLGLGIAGEEGMQAVMASDFALARFSFLKRLLLVHGHWCYDRLSRMTLYMWYKNGVFVFMLMWFQCFSGFSGGTFLDDFNLILFNLVYTSLPPIMFGVLEKDVDADALMSHPKLYRQGPTDWVYKRHSYSMQIINSLWQSLVAFFIPYFLYYDSDVSLWGFGFTANTACVMTCLMALAIETRTWGVFQTASIVLSMLAYYCANLILSAACLTCSHPANPYSVHLHTLQDPRHWLVVILAVTTALLPHFCIRVLQGTLWPSLVMQQRYAMASRYIQVLTGSCSTTSTASASSRFERAKHYYASWKCGNGGAGGEQESKARIQKSSLESLDKHATMTDTGVRHRRADSNGIGATDSDTII